MSKIKIAFILSGLGYVNRGTEVFFTEIMKRLSVKDDLEISAIGGGKNFNLENVKYTRIPCPKRNLFNNFPKIKRIHLKHGHDYEGLFFAIPLIPVLLTKKFDLIFFSTFPYELLAYKIYRRLRNPKVKTVFSSGGGTCFFYSRYFFADCVQATDPMSTEFLAQKFNSVCIPAGVDDNVFYPRRISRQEIDLPKDKFVIFSSSAFDPIKRLDFLIRAASQIDNAYLVLSSTGPQEEYLKKLGKELMGKNIKFLGIVDQETLIRHYSLADVYCLPSKIEPFGLVLVEAMACQTPVVTNNSEIQKWMIKDAGSCIDMTDINSLIKALEKYKDKETAQLTGKKGRENVLERFTWDIAAEKYHRLFKKLVN